MRFLIDENMPRSLARVIVNLGFQADDVRDIGLRGKPDEDVLAAAVALDAIVVTRDRGFKNDRQWPDDFTAGVILVNLPDDTPANIVIERVLALLSNRLPESLLGGLTFVEPRRALSRIVRRRP